MNRLLPSRWGLKWAGLVLTVLVAALWVVGTVWTVVHTRVVALGVERWTGMGAGCAYLGHSDFIAASGYTAGQSDGWHVFLQQDPNFWGLGGPILWMPDWQFASDRSFYVLIPLWIPALMLAVPTGCLWWRDRRPGSGHCAACGYDFAGLEAGAICPECGRKAVA